MWWERVFVPHTRHYRGSNPYLGVRCFADLASSHLAVEDVLASPRMKKQEPRISEELSFKDEAAAEYDRAFAHVTAHFMPFLLRAAHVAPGMRVLDIATGT